MLANFLAAPSAVRSIMDLPLTLFGAEREEKQPDNDENEEGQTFFVHSVLPEAMLLHRDVWLTPIEHVLVTRPLRVHLHSIEIGAVHGSSLPFLHDESSQQKPTLSVLPTQLKTYPCTPQMMADEHCAICQNAWTSTKDRFVALRCLHKFHPACLAPWLKRQAVCPLCRRVIERRDVVDDT